MLSQPIEYLQLSAFCSNQAQLTAPLQVKELGQRQDCDWINGQCHHSIANCSALEDKSATARPQCIAKRSVLVVTIAL
jgi:hypothetical protein